MTTYRSMTIVGLASVTALLLSAAPLAQGDGMTPLHLAAERGDHELAVSLLKAGADPAAVTRTGRYTPLHVAAKGGHHLVVRALVDAKADVGALTTAGGARRARARRRRFGRRARAARLCRSRGRARTHRVAPGVARRPRRHGVRAARWRSRHQPGERVRSDKPAAHGDHQRSLRSGDAAACAGPT